MCTCVRNVTTVLESNTCARDCFKRCHTCVRDFAPVYEISFGCWQVTQCKDCDGGYYCSVEGATNMTGPCDPGYYCQSGVDRSNPDNAANSTANNTCNLLGGHTGVFIFDGNIFMCKLNKFYYVYVKYPFWIIFCSDVHKMNQLSIASCFDRLWRHMPHGIPLPSGKWAPSGMPLWNLSEWDRTECV